MAELLTAAEVIARVKRLKDNKGMSDLRDDVRWRARAHASTNDPILPVHYAEGSTTIISSMLVPHHWQIQNAQLAKLPTSLTVVPGGPDQESKAGKAERALAVQRATLFTNEVRTQCRYGQGILGYSVYKLCCLDADAPYPWRVDVIDQLSVYFPKGPLHPRIVGREYTVMAHEVTDRYSQGRNKQEIHQDQMPIVTNGTTKWEALSDAVASGEGYEPDASIQDAFEPVNVVELDTGTDTYVVVKNKDGSSGELVWHYTNPHKGTAYWIVPGHETGAQEPREWLLPYLWALENVIDQLNFIMAIWATRATARRVQLAIEKDPEKLAAAKSLGYAREVDEAERDRSLANDYIEFHGKIIQIDRPKDEDLNAMYQAKIAEYHEIAGNELTATSSDVIKASTLGATQLAVGQREIQKGPLLEFEDIAESGIMQQVAETVANGEYVPNGEAWAYYAKGGEGYSKGSAKLGERFDITADLLKFEHPDDWIVVSTAALTDQQKEAQFQGELFAQKEGFSTRDKVLEARGVQDLEAFYYAKAVDDAYELAGQLRGTNTDALIFQEMMRLEFGIYLTLPGQAPVAAPVADAPTTGSPPPATEGAQGQPNPTLTA